MKFTNSKKCAFPNHINHLSSPARAAKATKMRKYANRINDERQRSISISSLFDRIKTKVNKSISAEKWKENFFDYLFLRADRWWLSSMELQCASTRARERVKQMIMHFKGDREKLWYIILLHLSATLAVNWCDLHFPIGHRLNNQSDRVHPSRTRRAQCWGYSWAFNNVSIFRLLNSESERTRSRVNEMDRAPYESAASKSTHILHNSNSFPLPDSFNHMLSALTHFSIN